MVWSWATNVDLGTRNVDPGVQPHLLVLSTFPFSLLSFVCFLHLEHELSVADVLPY